MEVVGRLLALLVLLLVGTGLRVAGVLDDARTQRLNDAAYFVALPALVFVSTYDRDVAELVSPALFGGILFVLLATAAVAWLVHRQLPGRGRRSVAVIQSYHANLGYLGLPLVAATFTDDVTAVASVVLGVGSLFQVPLTVFVLTTVSDADASLSEELAKLAKNPVLLALVGGLVVGSAGASVPAPATAGLDALGTLALPIALLCVGASLDVDLPDVDMGATGSVVAVKIAVMPAIAWATFSLLAVDAATFTAAVVMLGMPTAVSTYVFASELGGDESFASLNVFVTTLASVASLFVLFSVVG
ncbi:AEC family transporter [Halobacterium sp. CBA1126]|uniref:AEC family transporter n=1 Tax=Halobacterium sp. CBA1126 TaxID=2668074 RepID=UPI0012F8553D|nr:AEC family transporter [Halobacterium sp. CBA1126]MUV59295.1 AEC family transporter [Halobacterium sp. CBA1126]